MKEEHTDWEPGTWRERKIDALIGNPGCLSERSLNVILNMGLSKQQLAALSEKELLKYRGIGIEAVYNIQEWLGKSPNTRAFLEGKIKKLSMQLSRLNKLLEENQP